MLALLRLSIRIHRKRVPLQITWSLRVEGNILQLDIHRDTLSAQPLLRADLEHERTQLAVLGLVLKF